MRLLHCVVILFSASVIISGVVFLQRQDMVGVLNNELQLNTTSVEENFRLYWDASLKKDKALIGQISTFPPQDMFQDCIGNKKPKDTENDKYAPREAQETELKTNNNEEPIDPFTDKDIPADISLTSSYIFSSKIAFDKVKINGKNTYQDEATLDVIIPNERGEITKTGMNEKIFFFKRENQVWKLIGVGNKAVLFSISEKLNYAIPRPLCE